MIDDSAWVPLFGLIEVGVGLTSGSLPYVGALFHFFDAPAHNTMVVKMASRTVGGSPFKAELPPGNFVLVSDGSGCWNGSRSGTADEVLKSDRVPRGHEFLGLDATMLADLIGQGDEPEGSTMRRETRLPSADGVSVQGQKVDPHHMV